MKLLKRSKEATVWRTGNGWIQKQSNPEYTLNEFIMLDRLKDTGYVPRVELIDKEAIAIEDLGDQLASWSSITDPALFLSHLPLILDALKKSRVRHGDLTKYAIIVVENKPMLIDFAHSRDWSSPLPDKRAEGDEYWLTFTMNELVNGISSNG